MKNSIGFALCTILFFYGCKKDKDPTNPPASLNGIFIINEGSFGAGNGSVSFLERNTNNFIENIYSHQNQLPLGDVVSSMKINGGKGYIVVNNSQKIEVVSMGDFKRTGTVTGLMSPRFILPVNNQKAYVTDWLSGVVVVNINTLQIIKTIQAGNGPEQLINNDNKIYVVNGGGFDDDSTVTIINSVADTVLKTLTVGRNPNSIVKDKNNFIWILCGGDIGPDWVGGTADDVAGELIKINPQNDSIEARFVMPASEHPMKLTINKDGDILYFLNGSSSFDGKIYSMNINGNILPSSPLIDKTFYGLGVDPLTGNLLGAFVPGFNQKGFMFRYTNNGMLIDSVQAGVVPAGFEFN